MIKTVKPACRFNAVIHDYRMGLRRGRGSATWYPPTARMLDDSGSNSTAGRSQAGAEPAAHGTAGAGLTSNPVTLSSNLAALTSNPSALGSNLPVREDLLVDPRRQALLNEVRGGLAGRLGTIGRRYPRHAVQDLVVSLSELRPWRTEELAALLGRKAETVRQDYLRLGHRMRNHPNLTPGGLRDAPALIESVFPAQKVSFEAQKERGQKRDVVDMLNLVNEQTVGEKIYDRAQRAATGFDLRYTATMAPPDKDWRDCTAVLSRRDFAVLMTSAWSG